MRTKRAAVAMAAMSVAAAGALIGAPGSAFAAPGPQAGDPGVIVSALSTAAYGSVLMVGGHGPAAAAPLYELSSDAYGHSDCITTLTPTFQGSISCTGPKSDILHGVNSDEWPAFTTTDPPVAGPGVDQNLLGTRYRAGVGLQVTYAGHPLYLFDPPSHPFMPGGEGFFETVAPLPPWHGAWELVSADRGTPATGPATIETGNLPGGGTAVAARMYPNAVPGGVAVTAYSFSGDGPGGLGCTGPSAVRWIPVQTQGAPRVAGGITASDVGVIGRPNGTEQVTYRGRPLYLYSAEQAVFHNPSQPPQTTGSTGNGEGLSGPGGGQFSIVLPH